MFDWRDVVIFVGVFVGFGWFAVTWHSVKCYFASLAAEQLVLDVELVDDFDDEVNLHEVNDQLGEIFGSFRSNVENDEMWGDEEPTTVVEIKKPSLAPARAEA